MRAPVLALLAALAACRAPGAASARVGAPVAGSGFRTYFAADLDEDRIHELAELVPGLRIVAGLAPEEALRRAGEADGADARYATSEFLRAAPDLVWVQAHSAGVERYLAVPELAAADGPLLTNMAGVHGPAIADHAFAMLLALTRDLATRLDARDAGRWESRGSEELAPLALEGRTLLVVGLGGIGTEIARRAHGFGMRVVATRRHPEEPGPDFVERVAPAGALLELLGQADVVALCVPLTAETEGLIGAAAFAAMRPGSFLINVARGRVVDTEALVAALDSGRLAGACLDVTDPEPLPPEHPLWRRPNVVITPHVAARAELTDERAWELFRENLRRFAVDEPLLNVVDKAAGY
jgi:phosphoglycerate dehydrogenase-like enzyme